MRRPYDDNAENVKIYFRSNLPLILYFKVYNLKEVELHEMFKSIFIKKLDLNF